MLFAQRFEPRSEVDRVPIHCVALPSTAAYVAGDEWARVDTDANFNVFARKVAAPNSGQDRARRIEGLSRVTCVLDRHVEQCHYGVAMELRDDGRCAHQ